PVDVPLVRRRERAGAVVRYDRHRTAARAIARRLRYRRAADHGHVTAGRVTRYRTGLIAADRERQEIAHTKLHGPRLGVAHGRDRGSGCIHAHVHVLRAVDRTRLHRTVGVGRRITRHALQRRRGDIAGIIHRNLYDG